MLLPAKAFAVRILVNKEAMPHLNSIRECRSSSNMLDPFQPLSCLLLLFIPIYYPRDKIVSAQPAHLCAVFLP